MSHVVHVFGDFLVLTFFVCFHSFVMHDVRAHQQAAPLRLR